MAGMKLDSLGAPAILYAGVENNQFVKSLVPALVWIYPWGGIAAEHIEALLPWQLDVI